MPLKVENVRQRFQNQELRTVKMLVAGPPGSGKTLFASEWPGVLYADVEGRLLSVRDRDVNSVRIGSLADLEELKVMLDQDPDVRRHVLGCDVQTICLDTVDEIARLAMKERMRAEKLEAPRIADWGWLGDTLRGLLRGYRNLNLNVLLNVHVKSQEDSETGRVRVVPAIQGQVGDEIPAYVDIAVLLVARPTTDAHGDRVIERYMQTFPDLQHDWLKDHSNALPLEFPIDFTTDYARLSALIFSAPAPAAPPPSPAPAEVVPEPRKKPAAKKAAAPPPVKAPVADEELAVVGSNGANASAELSVSDPPLPVPEAGTEIAEPAPAPEPPAPEPAVTGELVCEECGNVIEPPDYAEFSLVRYGQRLCRQHFSARSKRS